MIELQAPFIRRRCAHAVSVGGACQAAVYSAEMLLRWSYLTWE